MAEKINIADLKIAYFGDKTVRHYIETIADADSTLRLRHSRRSCGNGAQSHKAHRYRG